MLVHHDIVQSAHALLGCLCTIRWQFGLVHVAIPVCVVRYALVSHQVAVPLF